MTKKMTDCVLIEPADNRTGDWNLQPVLGLGYIAAYLEKNDFGVSIIDKAFSNLTTKRILKQLQMFDSRIYGITALTQEIYYAHELAIAIKKQFPGSSIVIGGPHVTALPTETLQEFYAFDFGIIGEGEHTLLELLTKLKNKESDFDKIEGIAYRNNGKIRVNSERDWITNLDELPFPAWHLYSNIKGHKAFPIMTSRGCPFGCVFCGRALGDSLRFRSAQNVMDEIEWLINDFDAEYLSFEDDIFGFRNKRTDVFLDLCRKKKISQKIRWFAQSRADLADFDLFKKMKEAGCTSIGIGIESGNPEILRKTQKGITLQQAEKTIEFCKKLGIRSQAYFILGNPDDSVKTINETINFATKLDLDRVEFEILIPYPGTPVRELAKENKGGYASLSSDWRKYNKCLGAVLFTNIGNRRIKLLQIKAYLAFYIKIFRLKEFFLFFWRRKKSYMYQLKKLLITFID